MACLHSWLVLINLETLRSHNGLWQLSYCGTVDLLFTDVQHWNGRNSGSAGFSRSIAAEATRGQNTRGAIQWQVWKNKIIFRLPRSGAVRRYTSRKSSYSWFVIVIPLLLRSQRSTEQAANNIFCKALSSPWIRLILQRSQVNSLLLSLPRFVVYSVTYLISSIFRCRRNSLL